MHSETPLSPEVWERIPPEVQVYIRALEARVGALEETVQQLEATVHQGREQLQQNSRTSSRPPSSDPPQVLSQRPRRKPLGRREPHLVQALETWVDPVPRGDPMSGLRWTCQRAVQLAAALQAPGQPVRERTVNRLLHDLGDSLQSKRQTLAGRAHPEREAQFQDLNRRAKAFPKQGQPVVWVETNKQEPIGQFRNGGRAWQPQGQPEAVQGHDFADQAWGKVIPYGVDDDATNTGGVSVGVAHDTAACAGETVRRWWRQMGSQTYPRATRLLITADGGGSHGSRGRLWKVERHRLANETGRRLSVCHFPPGTSQWHTIEPRRFCPITEHWRGRPWVSREVVVNRIGHTTTKTGLAIRSALDEPSYPTGREVTAQQLESLAITQEKFHGEWNYTIQPRT
jgi:DDE family transposase/uncharacterized protein DUF6444